MNSGLPMLAIGLVFGGGIGFVLAAANSITLDGHDHSDPAHHGPATIRHDHTSALELPAEAAPKLAVEAFADPSSGWNLHIRVENFEFAPQNASRDHVAGEGHAHVYIDGEKWGRVYAPWVHLDSVPKGAELSVTLNSNDHRELSVGGAPLRAVVIAGE